MKRINKGSSTKQMLIIGGIIALVVISVWMIPNTVLSLDGMLSKGEMYQKTGRTALALKIYKKAIDMYPASYEAHLHMGNALLEADEPELAKVEFDKAVELSGNSKSKFDAQIAMSIMLISENKFDKAENLLLSVEDPKPDKIKVKLAELYTQWGDKFLSESKRNEAIEKYKLAFKNYDSLDVESQQKVEDKVIKTYIDIANYHLNQKKQDQAIVALNQSIDFIDNPTAHIKLAEMYRKQNKRDEAIAEYEKAYDLDTTGTAALYLGELLVDKGVELAKKNKMDEAKICFEKAQEANPSIIIPAEILYSISINKIESSLTPNTVTDKLFPKVSFVVENQGKDKIDFLKVQVVFFDSGNIISRIEKIVVSKKEPLESNESTKQITLSSSKGIEGIKKSHLIQAKVYLIYGDYTDWKFARTVTMTKQKDVFAVKGGSTKKPDTTTSVAVTSKPSLSTDTASTSITKKPDTGQVAVDKPQIPQVNTSMPVPQPIPIPVHVQPVSNPGGNSGVDLPPINKNSEFKIE
ncbi:MAG: tetratricopeptide repeat protein [Cyanobacteriota bacterium]